MLCWFEVSTGKTSGLILKHFDQELFVPFIRVVEQTKGNGTRKVLKKTFSREGISNTETSYQHTQATRKERCVRAVVNRIRNSLLRVPKGFRAPGLQGSRLKIVWLLVSNAEKLVL